MKKFDLWFPKERLFGLDPDAETAFAGKTAYICVTHPFDNGSGQHSMVKSKGLILLCNETASADECCRQIDSLIDDLKALKAKARQKFKD